MRKPTRVIPNVLAFWPIRIYTLVGIVIGIPITIEVAAVGGADIHRIWAKEPQRHRVVIPWLHVRQVGLRVGYMAGKAGAFAVDAVVGRRRFLI